MPERSTGRRAKLLAQRFVDLLRVRFAARRFHDLTYQEAEHLLLAGAELLDLRGIGGDDLGDELVDACRVGDLREAALVDETASKTSLAILPEIVPAAILSSSAASVGAAMREPATVTPLRFSAAVSSPMTQLAAIFGAAFVPFATDSK